MKRKKSQFVIEEPSFETTIILDEEKVKSCPYRKDKIENLLDELFGDVGMVRDGNTFKGGTFAKVGGVLIALIKTEWFMHLVKEMTLTEKDGDTVLSTESVFDSKVLRKMYFDKYGL